VPLFAGRGGQRGRRIRTVCRISTRGSELVCASSRDSEKKWQIRAAKWHIVALGLFTMFKAPLRRSSESRSGWESWSALGRFLSLGRLARKEKYSDRPDALGDAVSIIPASHVTRKITWSYVPFLRGRIFCVTRKSKRCKAVTQATQKTGTATCTRPSSDAIMVGREAELRPCQVYRSQRNRNPRLRFGLVWSLRMSERGVTRTDERLNQPGKTMDWIGRTFAERKATLVLGRGPAHASVSTIRVARGHAGRGTRHGFGAQQEVQVSRAEDGDHEYEYEYEQDSR
jgi:hypothetical protein